jgi:anti-sigma factor RsiW
MTCSDCLENLGPYVDGELPADEVALVEEHLRTCADCARAHRRLIDTSSQVKAGLMRYEAPDVLKARIRASLAAATGEAPTLRRTTQPTWSSRWSRAIAAAAVVALASSGLTVALMQQRFSGTLVEDQVLASHIRSLMPGHLTDVASNDQHNVKPWFNGRVNVSPDVPRLDSLGYPLVGGRVDYIEGHNVATVVYLRRQHVINVFSWPTPGAPDITSTILNSNGYHLIRARRNGVEVWIVSDVNLRELQDFARMVMLSH